jgi:hypothetical protein
MAANFCCSSTMVRVIQIFRQPLPEYNLVIYSCFLFLLLLRGAVFKAEG